MISAAMVLLVTPAIGAAMPSKTTGPVRQRRYRDRMTAIGFKQVSFYVPLDRLDELRATLDLWQAEQYGKRMAADRRLFDEPLLPLGDAQHD
jgi:hypothetical protein